MFWEASTRSSVLLQVKKRESGRITIDIVNTRHHIYLNSHLHSTTLNVIIPRAPIGISMEKKMKY